MVHDEHVAVTARSRATTEYRAVLRLPGVAPLTGVAFLARIPTTAAAITLTLHVVLTLGQGYGAAGLVGAATTVGMAIGAPLLGRLIDRRGLRSMLAVATVAEAVFWTVAPTLSYPALLVGALLGGMLGLPVFSVVRQSLAVMVPAPRRRTVFALDAMSVELSYIIGPALGATLALTLSTSVAMWIVGSGWVLSGLALWWLNPPTSSESGRAEPAAPIRVWLDLRMVGVLLATAAATFLLFGTELSMIAALQTGGHAGTIPLVNAAWCLASLAGGFAYGAARRTVSLFGLVAVLGAATLLVALGGPWWSYLFLLVPTGMLCAPSLAASAEAVSALAPERSRGLATGLHGSSITLGAAASTPLAGLLIDIGSTDLAVLVVGTAGIVLAGIATGLSRLSPSAVSQPI